jgi:hypothetical protein
MHLRRALLLFAIVLGLAALASSLARTPQRGAPGGGPPGTTGDNTPETTGDGVPGTTGGHAGGASPSSAKRVVMQVGPRGRIDTRRVFVGVPTTLIVEVRQPGEVRLEKLGLSSAADPLTPARFELLPEEPGRQPVTFDPAGVGPERSGTLVITER